MAAKAFFKIYCSSLLDHVERGEFFDDLRLHLHQSTNPPCLDMERAEVHDDDDTSRFDSSDNKEGEGATLEGEREGEGELTMICLMSTCLIMRTHPLSLMSMPKQTVMKS